jgi:hypothetical protein
VIKALFYEAEVRLTLARVIAAGAVFEVRALDAQLSGNGRTATISGYFNSLDACVTELRKLSGAKGIYVTLNPVNPALLARCANRLDYAKKNATTNDLHILERRWLLLDVDAERPSGVSASDSEKEAAHKKACEIRDYLKGRGWPSPIAADSGNGYHLLYRIDLPCDDGKVLEQVLAALASRFDGDGVKLDRSVHNAARIIRLYGTLAAKGDNTKERPHRISKILLSPLFVAVTAEQLGALVDELQPQRPALVKQPAASEEAFDVEGFLTRYSVEVAERTTERDGTIKWKLKHCPFNHDHVDGDAAVFQSPVGCLGFHCFHSSCTDKHWNDFRQHFEPGKIAATKQSQSKKLTSQADRLIKIGHGWEFFHTADHRSYACVLVNRHKETIAVRSRKFRALLIRSYHNDSGKAANTASIEEAVAFFEGAALCGKELAVHTRLATYGGVIYLDLCNERWDAVEITADGWRVVADPPVKFRRTRGMLPLPTPTGGGRVSDLRPFVNVANDDDFALSVAFMLAALRPGLPCPIEVLHGEQGSAKSTTAKVQKKLLDPAEPLLRSLPRDGRDLFIAASNSSIVALDNVSGLPVWLSDDLCRLATGGGFATRELYSDDEEKIFSALRPVILNGIEEIATRSDLLDRSILLELPMIPKEKRRVEADFWREFEQVRPGILGALLDAVVCGLKNLPTTRLESCPRMADFATWIVACEPTLDWPRGTFLEAYERNRDEANSLSVEASVIGTLIQEIAAQGEWIGTATELLKELSDLGEEDAQKQWGWPKNGRAVSGQLKRIAPNLRAEGVIVNWLPRTSGGRQIQILRRVTGM